MIALVTKGCPCGERFAFPFARSRGKPRRFCTLRCGVRYASKLHRASKRKRETVTRTCGLCERVFPAGYYYRGRKGYCSDVCRRKHRYLQLHGHVERAESGGVCDRCEAPMDPRKYRRNAWYCSRKCRLADRYVSRRLERATAFRSGFESCLTAWRRRRSAAERAGLPFDEPAPVNEIAEDAWRYDDAAMARHQGERE